MGEGFEPERDADGAKPANLAGWLEDILREQIRKGAIVGSHPASYLSIRALPLNGVPLVIGLTMKQVLDAADDAEVRADVLDGVSGIREERNARPRTMREHVLLDRRVGSLREAAAALRRISTQLEDDWPESEGTL